jgi:hypothetical protein
MSEAMIWRVNTVVEIVDLALLVLILDVLWYISFVRIAHELGWG